MHFDHKYAGFKPTAGVEHKQAVELDTSTLQCIQRYVAGFMVSATSY
jgi:hypothetical protein